MRKKDRENYKKMGILRRIYSTYKNNEALICLLYLYQQSLIQRVGDLTFYNVILSRWNSNIEKSARSGSWFTVEKIFTFKGESNPA